jgi:hypothetical protein
MYNKFNSVKVLIFKFFYLGLSSFLRFSSNHSGFLDHIQLTHKVGLLWTSDQPIVDASTYTGQHNIETHETNISTLIGIRTRDPCKRPQTYALDRAATEVGLYLNTVSNKN